MSASRASTSSSVDLFSARALNEFLMMAGWRLTDMSGVGSSEMSYVVVWVVRARMEPGVMGGVEVGFRVGVVDVLIV